MIDSTYEMQRDRFFPHMKGLQEQKCFPTSVA